MARCFLCEKETDEVFTIVIPEPDGTPDEVEICRTCNFGPEENNVADAAQMKKELIRPQDMDACLDAPDDYGITCKGAVEYRPSLSGTGTAIPRCDAHWERRLEEQDRINETYGPDSDLPPSWFHGSWGGENEYGERWDSDY